MGKFALGEEKLVRQIFPSVITMDIAALGSNGFFVSNFSAMYPKNLSIFVPIDYVTNRMSSSIPAEFESFFHPLDEFLSYFSRLTEEQVPTALKGRNVEYAIGKFSDFEYKGKKHDTFAIMPKSPNGAVSLLCRQLVHGDKLIPEGETSQLCDAMAAGKAVSEIRGIIYPSYISSAKSCLDENDVYVYWNMSPTQVFNNPNLALAELMLSTPQYFHL